MKICFIFYLFILLFCRCLFKAYNSVALFCLIFLFRRHDQKWSSLFFSPTNCSYCMCMKWHQFLSILGFARSESPGGLKSGVHILTKNLYFSGWPVLLDLHVTPKLLGGTELKLLFYCSFKKKLREKQRFIPKILNFPQN